MSVAMFRGTITLTVEIALSAATGTYGAWNVATWGNATWGPEVLWVDVSDRVRIVETSRRFSRSINTWDGGTARIVLGNRDGALSPSNLAGPYVTAGVTAVRPWRPVRISATYNGVTYPIYRGYVLAFKEGWSKAQPGSGDAWVTASCVDEFASLGRVAGVAGASVGVGERTGVRIHRILDAAGHIGERAIDLGDVTVQATDLAANTVAMLTLTADSEGGAVYVDRAGVVRFDRRYALIENTRSNTMQATFDDGGGLRYTDIEPDYDGELLVNDVSMTRVGGTAQRAADETSRALYGTKRVSRTDLVCETDSQAAALAQYRLLQGREPEQRISSITVHPRRDPSQLFPAVLGREVRDLVRVSRTPPGGYTVTRDCHVSGVAHSITPASWRTRLDLWSAAIYQGVGRWDVATWDGGFKWFI